MRRNNTDYYIQTGTMRSALFNVLILSFFKDKNHFLKNGKKKRKKEKKMDFFKKRSSKKEIAPKFINKSFLFILVCTIYEI